MTRINLVEPSQLTTKHLMAEYRELPRVFTAVEKLQSQGKSPEDIEIPESYVLGQGHVKFFYDKVAWLRCRFISIGFELINRGVNIDERMFCLIQISASKLHDKWQNGYVPSPEEIYLNMARICKRSKLDKVLDELTS